MKILYITLENVSLHKGSVVHIREIIAGLRSRGHQVGLIARASGPLDDSDVFYNLSPCIYSTSKLSWIRKFINKHSMFFSLIFLFGYLLKIAFRYDVIYARDYHAAAIALIPCLFFKKRIVFEINGLASEEQRMNRNSFVGKTLGTTIKKVERLAAKFSDRVIAVTPQIASYIVSDHGCQPNKVKIISNGVNLKLFHPVPDNDMLSTARKNLGIKMEDAVVVFVGNLAPWQGIESLIQVAPELIKEVEDLKFLIVGDGILRSKIEAEVNQRGISQYFVITGMVEYTKIPLYINVADICVLLKRRLSSGFSPLKLYEYMACGKPILATRVEGLEFIEKEGIGRLIEPDNLVEIRTTLSEMIKNQEDRVKMGRRSLRLALDKFSWDSKVIEIEKILETLG